MQLSVVVVAYNEEANIGRTLASVAPLVADGRGEIVVVDSGSADRTLEIARQHGARVLVEPWRGFAAQKNFAVDHAAGDWILLLDADEAVDDPLAREISRVLQHATTPSAAGFFIPRKNYFLGRWIRHGGFWPDPKLRLFRRGSGRVEDRAVHETVRVNGATGTLHGGALVHHSYPTLSDYIAHMNRYSSLGAQVCGPRRFSLLDIVFRPLATFIYNYFLRLGFLDGPEGLLLHLYHAAYVSWKYSKAWELRTRE